MEALVLWKPRAPLAPPESGPGYKGFACGLTIGNRSDSKNRLQRARVAGGATEIGRR